MVTGSTGSGRKALKCWSYLSSIAHNSVLNQSFAGPGAKYRFVFLSLTAKLGPSLYLCGLMKSKTLKKDKVNIITLGCSKNLVDSEVLSGQLAANDISVVHENAKLDHNISVVNTCGFIDKAKEESINTILDQLELKRRGKLDKVYVTGCLSERYRNDLEKEMPEVDAWFGTLELPLILKQFDADYKTELLGERLLSTPKHYAYLKISEGCNRTCSFCAIPLMRGQHVSKPIEQLVAEAEGLVERR
jgi:ribosomal protein S12 methylthiotransferase